MALPEPLASRSWSRLRIEADPELDGLVTVSLARPEKLNAIDAAMHRELQEACAIIAREPAIRVVVFAGEGRAFSAGADLGRSTRDGARFADEAMTLREPPLVERERALTGVRTAEAIEALPQVTIGAVHGFAVGGAVVLLACMDLRLAEAGTWFSIPEVPLGIPLTWGALPRLVRELGPARVRELVLFGDRFSAEAAERWGFLNAVTARGFARETARAWAARLLATDPLAVALTKSQTRALADAMVPAHGAYADADLLTLVRAVRAARPSPSEAGPAAPPAASA
ncbi:Short-chain-enoyl-CoA hydratase [bacterium HR29]|nr:Short-chain-enoyl-CoA hydratase [bacterium HR29]